MNQEKKLSESEDINFDPVIETFYQVTCLICNRIEGFSYSKAGIHCCGRVQCFIKFREKLKEIGAEYGIPD